MSKQILPNEKIINILKYKKIFYIVSISIFVIGLIFNVINGTTMSIEFAGGSMFQYSYIGDLDKDKIEDIIEENANERDVSFTHSDNALGNKDGKKGYTVTAQFGGNEEVSIDTQTKIINALQQEYKENEFALFNSSSVEATMGLKFLFKCLAAVAIASIFMMLYVAFRFRRIGGLSAGVTALIALAHDVGFIYVMYVIFQMPIDDNFIAVVLTIIGYSLNDTIIIYDRVREERKAFGPKADIADVFNYSFTKVLKRTLFTSIATFIAIFVVYIVALIYKLDSVTAFAFPMMLGVVCGAYSTVCIAGPLWVTWKKRKTKK